MKAILRRALIPIYALRNAAECPSSSDCRIGRNPRSTMIFIEMTNAGRPQMFRGCHGSALRASLDYRILA